MANYGIPQKARLGFKKMTVLNSEQLNSLIETIKKAGVGEDIRDIIDNNDVNGLSKNELGNVLMSLFSLVNIFLESNDSVTKFSDEFSISYKETIEDKNEINEVELENFRNNLIQILPSLSTSIKYTIKAKELMTSNQNNYREAKIISDIRLVYDDQSDLKKKEQYSLVVHHLKVRYFNSINLRNEFYVSLNLTDLKELQKVLQRAIEKDELLRSNHHDLTFIDLK